MWRSGCPDSSTSPGAASWSAPARNQSRLGGIRLGQPVSTTATVIPAPPSGSGDGSGGSAAGAGSGSPSGQPIRRCSPVTRWFGATAPGCCDRQLDGQLGRVDAVGRIEVEDVEAGEAGRRGPRCPSAIRARGGSAGTSPCSVAPRSAPVGSGHRTRRRPARAAGWRRRTRCRRRGSKPCSWWSST